MVWITCSILLYDLFCWLGLTCFMGNRYPLLGFGFIRLLNVTLVVYYLASRFWFVAMEWDFWMLRFLIVKWVWESGSLGWCVAGRFCLLSSSLLVNADLIVFWQLGFLEPFVYGSVQVWQTWIVARGVWFIPPDQLCMADQS